MARRLRRKNNLSGFFPTAAFPRFRVMRVVR
jgi:hypothetical protein